MIKSKTGHIPAWVLNHLVSYGNCAIGRKLYKDLGKSLLPILLKEGFDCECIEIEHTGEGKSGTTYMVKCL